MVDLKHNIRLNYIPTLLVWSIFFSFYTIQAQPTKPLSFIKVGLGAQQPFLDLAKDYGSNLNLNASVGLKWNKHWISGIGFEYLFGTTVKQDVLYALRNDVGYVTNNEGYPADVRITQRGFQVYFKWGYQGNLFSDHVFWVFSPAVTYLEHQVYLYDVEKKVVALQNESIKGYDRLCNGLGIRNELGIMYLSKNRLSNFYIGFDATFAWTKNQRRFAYGIGELPHSTRRDALAGIRCSWILPLYTSAEHSFYK